MRRTHLAVVAGLALLLAVGWWGSRATPAPSEPGPPVDAPLTGRASPAAASLVPEPELPALRGQAPGDTAIAVEYAGTSEPCTPIVSLGPLDGGQDTLVRVSVSDGGQAPLPVLRLEFDVHDGGDDYIDLIAPSAVFHLRACGARRMIILSAGARERIEQPAHYEQVDVLLEPGPSYLVTGRVEHKGRGVAGVEVECPGGQPETTDKDGRFRLECRGRGFLSLEAPWRFSYPVYVNRFGDDVVDVGDRPAGRMPPIEPGKIGVGWDVTAAEPTALMVVAGSPAELSGLKAGDVLLEIDGHAIANIEEGMKLIPGAPGTPLRLKVRRGADIFLVDLIRQPELPDE